VFSYVKKRPEGGDFCVLSPRCSSFPIIRETGCTACHQSMLMLYKTPKNYKRPGNFYNPFFNFCI
jgi:hypothetical protein